jgi:hypothetical protein
MPMTASVMIWLVSIFSLKLPCTVPHIQSTTS